MQALRYLFLLVPVFLLAGCGGSGSGKRSGPKSYALDIQVKGFNLSKANLLYKKGEELYLQGGMEVPERQRKANLSAAIKNFSAAKKIYQKALLRHPKHMQLDSRVRDCGIHIDGCRRMINLNLMDGMKFKSSF